MAPEQMQEYPRPASDQYALAITVYEWLIGQRPFTGTFTEIAIKHAMVSPPPLRDKRPTLPPAVEQVVLTALAKKPWDRFASVQSFASALEQASQTDLTSSSLAENPAHSVGFESLGSSLAEPEIPSDQIPSSLAVQKGVPSNASSHMTSPTLPILAGPSPILLPTSTTPIVTPTSLCSPAMPVASSSITPSRSQMITPPAVQTQQLSLPPLKPSRRTFRRRGTGLLLGLAILLIAGGAASFLLLTKGSLVPGRAVATPTPNLLTVAALGRYDQAIASDGVMFGFDAQHSRDNTAETILNRTNVSRLVQAWTASTGDYIFSSPVVAHGIVLVGCNDHKLYASHLPTY